MLRVDLCTSTLTYLNEFIEELLIVQYSILQHLSEQLFLKKLFENMMHYTLTFVLTLYRLKLEEKLKSLDVKITMCIQSVVIERINYGHVSTVVLVYIVFQKKTQKADFS